MAASDWLLILAVLLSPIVALRVSRALDRRQERRRQLLDAFHTLLATRAEKTSPQHAHAINTVGLEFHARRLFGPLSYHSAADATVLESWHVYRMHLNTPPIDAADAAHTSHAPCATHTQDAVAWNRRADELLNDLLRDLARTLGYAFDRGFIERGMYAPDRAANSPRPPAIAVADDARTTRETQLVQAVEDATPAPSANCAQTAADREKSKKKKKHDRKKKPGGLPRFSPLPPRSGAD